MPESPGPDDRLGLSLKVAWSKVNAGYRGALIDVGTGRWTWECLHEPHETRDDALECAMAEVTARRVRLA